MMTLEDDPIAHGSTMTLRGENYVAVSLDIRNGLNCDACAFQRSGPGFTADCANTNCRGVVWMTLTKYITHRLTT